jgi:hypothetical protein
MAVVRGLFQAHVDDIVPGSGTQDPATFQAQWNLPIATGTLQRTTLATGDNTIAVPAGTTLILVTPPATAVGIMKIKGAAGDTGIIVSRSQAMVLSYESGPLIVNIATGTPTVTFSFF